MKEYSHEEKNLSEAIKMEFSDIVDKQERSVMIIGEYEDSSIIIFYNHLKNEKQMFEVVADPNKPFRRWLGGDESGAWQGLLVTLIEDQTLESFELLKKLSRDMFGALNGAKIMDH